MTPRDRLLRTLQGQPTDRAPIYTQIPFALDERGFKPGPFHGYEDYDDWREQDPLYRELVQRMQEECDNLFVWRPPCMLTSPFFVPLDETRTLPPEHRDEKVVTARTISIGDRELRHVEAVQPGTGHTWVLKHWCETPDDARRLLELPWNGHPATAGDFSQQERLLGDRGLIWVTVPSPILVVCRLFDPTEFLVYVRTEPVLIHQLLEKAAERIETNLRALLEAGVGPVIRFGGAEHATPPLMSPDDFDALVVRYDEPLMRLAKEHGRLVAVHCHGRLRHALKRFVEMGVDQTDPVEQEPDGDLTLREAREIAGEQITLTGNVQLREMASTTPDEIRDRVRQILADAGPNRLIVTTTGTPIAPVNPELANNYHTLISATLEGRPA
jgi:hypothetical protein